MMRLMMVRARRRGVAIITVMMVLVILFVLAVGFMTFMVNDINTSEEMINADTAYYMAHAGLEYGVYLFRHNLLLCPSQSQITLNATPPTATPTVSYNPVETTNPSVDLVYNPSAAPVGSILNVAGGTGGLQERVVICNNSFSATPSVLLPDNWLGQNSYIGTFQLSGFTLVNDPMNPSDSSVQLVSVGLVRSIPSLAVNSSGVDFSSLSGPTPTVPLGPAAWTIKNKRTLNCTIDTSHLLLEDVTTGLPTNTMNISAFVEQNR